jgi:primosomal protein N' (replication factor Y)
VTERFAQVALPLPLADPYTYAIPAVLADRALPGARVVVPVRQRELIGIVTAVDVPAPTVQARAMLLAPDAEPALPPALLRLGQRVARYYGAPIGLVLRAMLPGALWGKSHVELVLSDEYPPRIGGTAGDLVEWLYQKGGRASVAAASRGLRKPVWDVAGRLERTGVLTLEVVHPEVSGAVITHRIVELTGEPLSLAEREARFSRSARQRELYQAIEARGGRAPVAELLAALQASESPLKALQKAGLVQIGTEAAQRDPFAELPVAPPTPEPSDSQRAALASLAALAPGSAALLFGVTGSGKTLVYLERVRAALDAGQGAIILVPEIALTPQTVARVRGLFGDAVAVLHSGLSEGERADAWRALRRGERRVAVGARSAVFAPVANLGVIVLDEEHEASYKNTETPRYHAREVAAMRARDEGSVLVLGSATPSLDSWVRLHRAGTILHLPERVQARPMPPVDLVDLRVEPNVPGVHGLPWSRPLDDALVATLARGEQALLLLNRRGWAAYLQCRECGTVAECPECSISLTVHRHPEELRCHYCNHREPVRSGCQACGGATSRTVGAGTQQLERLVAERFPEARLARMDLDTTGAKWSHHHILSRVERGEVDVLLGTQMIAKGIDFPNVTMVGVVDADTALHLPDFRAAERTFQLVAQVAGRAGRGPRGGRVLVQSRQPEHPALVCAAAHDAERFLALETEARRSPPYPPHVALVHLVVSGEDADLVARRAVDIGDWAERTIARHRLDIRVVGPAPAPIERIKGRSRHHLMLKGTPAALGRWIRASSRRLGAVRGVRIAIDRDPIALL